MRKGTRTTRPVRKKTTKKRTCKHTLKSGKKCSFCARINGLCTNHFIKSPNYRGTSHNIRRKKVIVRRKKVVVRKR